MSIYFFFARMYLKDSASNKEGWLDTYTEAIVLQEKLRDAQYPMHKIAAEIAASVPDELTKTTSFQLLDPGQLNLTLENTEAVMAQKIVEDIENLPYITELQLLYAESQGEEDAQLRFELIISLDEDLIVEEETE